jgi:diaminopimelate epimerase
MDQLKFSKYSGAGNDFILIDNRDEDFPMHREGIIPGMAARRISIGADGVILLENSSKADFKMRIFNSDGSEAEMCGNGARCLIAFARKLGIEKEKYTFETKEKILHARYVDADIEIEMGPPADIKMNMSVNAQKRDWEVHFINTGVPHAVIFVDDINGIDVVGIGREIRYSQTFKPKGTNVDFVEIYDEDYIKIRTYERGVEDETLACGTGMTAAAIISNKVKGVEKPVWILVRSNDILRVSFENEGNSYKDVTLRGPATLIYDGVYYYNRNKVNSYRG